MNNLFLKKCFRKVLKDFVFKMFFETFFANTISHVNVYISFILLLDLPSTNLTKNYFFFSFTYLLMLSENWELI